MYDPFAGSNTTGAVAESLRRYWLASDDVEEYMDSEQVPVSVLRASLTRFYCEGILDPAGAICSPAGLGYSIPNQE